MLFLALLITKLTAKMLKTTATPNKINISLERSRLGKTTSILAAFSLKISMLGKKKKNAPTTMVATMLSTMADL